MANSDVVPAVHNLLPILDWMPGYRYCHVRRHPEAVTFPGLLIWRIGGNLFFASIGYTSAALKASLAVRPDVRHVLLDFASVNFIDVSAADELSGLVKDPQKTGILVAFARVRDAVRDDMKRAGIEAVLRSNNGTHNGYPQNHDVRSTCACRAYRPAGRTGGSRQSAASLVETLDADMLDVYA